MVRLPHLSRSVSRPARSERLQTPATAITLCRPLLALVAGIRLWHGQPGVFWIVLLMAASDLEGQVARLIDKLFPGSGYGTTKAGAAADKYADVAALIIVSLAALAGPKVAVVAKLAVGIILAHELLKVGQALYWGVRYKRLTGKNLDFSPSFVGKMSMAEKLGAITAAVITNDIHDTGLRSTVSLVAGVLAVLGIVHGEQARAGYNKHMRQLLRLRNTPAGD